MKQITLSQHTLETALQGDSGNYYIITEEINIPPDGLDFPQGSVLEFRGGSFKYEPPSNVINAPIETTVRLNGSIVSAPAYGIFPSNVQVSGFANSLIHADWFSKGYSLTTREEEYINRALVAAKGCPVTLEHRTYNLLNPIKIKNLYANSESGSAYYNHHTPQTLIVPGTLKLNEIKYWGEDPNRVAAIEVYAHHVTLKVNQIKGYPVRSNTPETAPTSGSPQRGGVGIRLMGDNYHLNIEVQELYELHKGFDIVPTYNKSIHNDNIRIGIQYCKITFSKINATYGFYIDKYSGRSTKDISLWFNENRILGGELTGTNGIYFKDYPTDLQPNEYIAPMDGLVFENIGFEELDGIPLKIDNVAGCRFIHMRFMEADSLPKDSPWIELRNVANTDIWIKGQMNPDFIKVYEDTNSHNHTRGTIIKSWVQDDGYGYNSRFDSLAIMPLQEKKSGSTSTYINVPTLTAYNSIVPSNMAKTIIIDQKDDDGTGSEGIDTNKATYYIKDILPVRDSSVHDSDTNWDTKFNVLPRTLNVIMGNRGELMILNVTGLQNFAPSVLDIFLYAPGGKQLKITNDDSNVSLIDTNYEPPKIVKEVVCNETGLYRLTWDESWNLVITRVVS